MTAPILVFGWGNPSRGDDALGPLFVERIEAMNLPGVECLTDFQLQVEHALDLDARRLVLFADASLDVEPPFSVRELDSSAHAGCDSHALAPEALLQVYLELRGRKPPPCHLLAIRGERFELGTGLSTDASSHLEAAVRWARGWFAKM